MPQKDEVALTEPDETQDLPDSQPPPQRRRGRQVGLWLIFSVLALVVTVALGLFLLTGRAITIPGWISNRAELLLAEQMPRVDISLGRLGFVIEDGFQPRLRARDMQLREKNGTSVIKLEEVDVILSFDSLLEARIAPKRIRVSGVFLGLRRLDDGSFNLSFGEGGQSGEAIDLRTSLSHIGTTLGEVLDQPFLAEMKDVEITGLNMRYEDVRAGRGWTIDGGQARMQREGSDVSFRANLVALGARAYVSAVEASIDLSLETNVTHFGLTFEDMPAREIASQTPALAWLEILTAPISGSLRASTDENGVLGPTAAVLQIGKGALQPNDDVPPIPFDHASTYLTYDPVAQTLSLDQFTLQADHVAATAHGKAMLRRHDLGIPQELLVQLEFTEFEVNPKLLEHSPLALDNAYADFRLRLDPFELTLGQLVLAQQGQHLTLSGHMKPGPRYWDYGLDGHMTQLQRKALLALWPEDAKKGLRKFIDERILNIALRDINVAVRSRKTLPPDVYADFQFHDLDLQFMPSLPPLRAASGVASFIRNQFLVGAEAGYVEADEGGRLDVAGTGFVVQNTQIKQSPATVRLAASGPVTAALSLLNRPPLEIMDKAKLPVDLATGSVRAVGLIDIVLKPKLTPEEVRFSGNLALDGVETTHFIKDKLIAADLRGEVDNSRIVLEGAGKVGAVPVTARWEAPIGPGNDGSSTVSGQAEISRTAAEEFNTGLPPETFSETATADFRLDIRKGSPPELVIGSDMVGLGVDFPPLGYSKPPETPGRFEMNMVLASPVRVDRFAYDAPGLAVAGAVSMRDEGGLDRVSLASFEVGNWLSGSGALVGRGEGAAPGILVSSGSFDIRGLPDGSGGGTGAEAGGGTGLGPIEAQLQRVQISDSFYLTDFQGSFEDQGGLTGDFTGLFNGVAPVRGEMVTAKAGPSFKVTSDRGGQILSEIGIARTNGTGDFRLTIGQTGPGTYDGRMKVDDVRVLDAPAFAELLNAVSVIGLLDQLNGPGIPLTEVAARFRLTPETLFVSQASAVGPGMGISLDGAMSLENNEMNFQGAFSPVYILNAVGRPISKKGEGLVAFNYTLSGTPDDMSIGVNPLSALTPGFLREIFRAPSPVDPAAPAAPPEDTDTSPSPSQDNANR